MSNGLEPGLLKWLADNVWAGILALLAALWGFLRADIHRAQRTADAALPRQEFERIHNDAVQDRLNLRNDVKELFERDDRLKDLINSKIDALRDDMHEQFRLLREELKRRR